MPLAPFKRRLFYAVFHAAIIVHTPKTAAEGKPDLSLGFLAHRSSLYVFSGFS